MDVLWVIALGFCAIGHRIHQPRRTAGVDVGVVGHIAQRGVKIQALLVAKVQMHAISERRGFQLRNKCRL
ncbi:hypothetical protein D3C85_1415020 [compost metagenome]